MKGTTVLVLSFAMCVIALPQRALCGNVAASAAANVAFAERVARAEAKADRESFVVECDTGQAIDLATQLIQSEKPKTSFGEALTVDDVYAAKGSQHAPITTIGKQRYLTCGYIVSLNAGVQQYDVDAYVITFVSGPSGTGMGGFMAYPIGVLGDTVYALPPGE